MDARSPPAACPPCLTMERCCFTIKGRAQSEIQLLLATRRVQVDVIPRRGCAFGRIGGRHDPNGPHRRGGDGEFFGMPADKDRAPPS